MNAKHFTTIIVAIALSAGLMGCHSSSEACRAGDCQSKAAEHSATQPQFWNYLWVRGSSSIDVALFNYGHSLRTRGNNELRGFEVAGKDRSFHPANAQITSQITEDGKLKVTWINLSSEKVDEPFYIRYATGEHAPIANLVNTLGEPAATFSTAK